MWICVNGLTMLANIKNYSFALQALTFFFKAQLVFSRNQMVQSNP